MITDKMVEEGFAALMRSSAKRAGASDGNTYVVRFPTIKDFRAALEAAEAAAWETIDTAPKNGSGILVAGGGVSLASSPETFWSTSLVHEVGWDEFRGAFVSEGGCQDDEPDFYIHHPTHWRHLPDGPKKG